MKEAVSYFRTALQLKLGLANPCTFGYIQIE